MQDLIWTMVVEQTGAYKKRMVYDPIAKTFSESEYETLSSTRPGSFDGPYGWIAETGTPPAEHLDVMLMSNDHFELGDEVQVRVIGYLRDRMGTTS